MTNDFDRDTAQWIADTLTNATVEGARLAGYALRDALAVEPPQPPEPVEKDGAADAEVEALRAENENLTMRLGKATEENENLTMRLGKATEEAVGWRAVVHNRSVTDIVAGRDRLLALLDPDNDEAVEIICVSIKDHWPWTGFPDAGLRVNARHILQNLAILADAANRAVSWK